MSGAKIESLRIKVQSVRKARALQYKRTACAKALRSLLRVQKYLFESLEINSHIYGQLTFAKGLGQYDKGKNKVWDSWKST